MQPSERRPGAAGVLGGAAVRAVALAAILEGVVEVVGRANGEPGDPNLGPASRASRR